MDPARADWYGEQGMRTISPTKHAIQMFESALVVAGGGVDVYAIIAGAGKVGRNLARELLAKDHEVTVIENSRPTYLANEEEFEHAVPVRRRHRAVDAGARGIQRADLVIAVTGDDEDNILVCQVAKEKYLCDRDDRPRQQPSQPRPLPAAGHHAGGLRH